MPNSSKFKNVQMQTNLGTFIASWDATVSTNLIDAVVGFGQTNIAQYPDLATILRFNSSGQIDMRNGGAYAADNTINYSNNPTSTVYHFATTNRVASHTYDASVKVGGVTTMIGTGYAFRTEQSGVTNLDVIGMTTLGFNTILNAYNFSIAAAGGPAAPSITTQPTNATVAIGGQTNITVAATTANSPLSYQWFRNGQTITSGGQSNVLTVPTVAAQCSDGGSTYYCLVADSLGFQQQSSSVTLAVNGCDPYFIVQPISQSIIPPAPATFNSTVSGTPNLTYQWYKNGVLISGATSAGYTTPATSTADYGAVFYNVAKNGNSVTAQGAPATLNQAIFTKTY